MTTKAGVRIVLILVAFASAMSPSFATIQPYFTNVDVWLGYYLPSPDSLESTYDLGFRAGYSVTRRVGLYGEFEWVRLDPINLRYFLADFVTDVHPREVPLPVSV